MSTSVNITQLARQYHATTPNMRKRLDRLGVKPLQEILMPSGRKFVLFDSAEAFQVLEQEKRAREALVAQYHAASIAPVAVSVEAPETDIKALQDEVTALKQLMQQMLDAMTTPKTKG